MNKHISVMLNETVDLLNVTKGKIYVDGTLGRGGHSEEILKRLDGDGLVYVFDLDNEAIKQSKERLAQYQNVIYIHDNFANMFNYLDHVDGILLDLGVSSPQFDEGDRGFSYRFNGPLDMRMDQEAELTAAKIINNYSAEELCRIFRDYGEEQFAWPIAKAIVKNRENKAIETTFDLVELIKDVLPAKVLAKKGHPAKQCFQALRIAVNHELDSLETFLERFDEILNPGGRVSVITFHSLEDRLVKRRFKQLSTVFDDLRIAKRPEDIQPAAYRLINHKSITASKAELENNNRAKSARLRAIEKVR